MLTDDEILYIYSSAVDASMRAASERDGFASNMTRESRVAGLRAIEREAAARALEEFAEKWATQDGIEALMFAKDDVSAVLLTEKELRTRAAKIREGGKE